jgi:flagellar protein FliL
MANPDEPAGETAAAKPPAKGGVMKWVLIGIGAFVLATLSQALAPLLTQPLGNAIVALSTHEAPAADAAPGEEGARVDTRDPLYAPLNPPMVVNFANDPTGFMQVEVQLMARDKSVIELVKANEPAVRNALLMLYAGKTRSDVTTREGKEKLREETLTEVQHVLAPFTHDDNVEDVYFTSLIAQ